MLGDSDRVVVIGAGHAGVELAAALRQRGFAGHIQLISEEGSLPYQRPPLSKEFIGRPDKIPLLRPATFYDHHKVSLHLGSRAVALDRARRNVSLSDGKTVDYDHLVFATGAVNRKLPLVGMDPSQVMELRSLDDAQSIIERVGSWRRMLIIGGGFIGLEAASYFAHRGVEIELIEREPRLMARAISPIVSSWFGVFHRQNGVRLHMSQSVDRVERTGDRLVLTTTTNDRLAGDVLLLAAGVVPNTEIASRAGLDVDNGIVVDQSLSTSDPAISAIGDCARYPSVHYRGMIRVESVQNAVDHAKALADRLTGGEVRYSTLPWFWSIQGEARLQIAGLVRPALTEVTRGDPGSGKFSVYLFEGNTLQAVQSINAPGEHLLARKLIGQHANVTPERAADLSFDLKALAIGS